MQETIISKIRTFLVKQTASLNFTAEDGIKYWQERLQFTILFFALVPGLFIYISSVLLSIKEQLWLVAIADTIVYLWVIILFFRKTIPYMVRAVSIVFITYILGLVLLITVGAFGAGPVWLFAFPIITALLMNLRFSLIAIAINISTIVVIGILLLNGHMYSGDPKTNAIEAWIVIGANFIFLNTLVTILTAIILQGLQDMLEQRKNMVVLLEQKQNDLLETNLLLEDEIKGHISTEESRKIAEAKFLQSQKMESVGRLAGGVAHDYNNALSVIVGFTELAINKMGSSDPVRDDLAEVLKAATQATDVTRQLLAFARKQTIVPKVLDLNENLEGMLKMIRRLIGEDIDLAWLPATNLWPVKLDPSQIDQIMANLCVNARDAIEDVGKVTIETGNSTFDAVYCAHHAGYIPGHFVLLSVSDDGCGMDKELLDNIFEPFFTTKDVNRGTGLGLSTVFGIVNQNKGFINVYSEPGQGTTFNIYLPRYEGEDVEIERDSTAEIPQGHGETILLVEDDRSILKLVNKILQGLGYTVLTADTPGNAIDIAGQYNGEIHLLISDVIMPEMNGRDLAEQLQSSHPDLKVIFMSGYTAEVIARHGILDEGVQFIQKPFSRTDLATRVRKVLDE